MKGNCFYSPELKKLSLVAALFLFFIGQAAAQNLHVAIAANLQPVIKELGKDFKNKTGITIEPIAGASGNLTSQIKNGAPFDVFLSADMNFPETLFKDSFATKKPVVYAQGSLVICSSQDIGFENWERMLLTGRVKKIAIANPAIAPYGKAAEEALKKRGVWDDVAEKIVRGESISQVNTYITTGVVDVGFTTRALVADPSSKTVFYWAVIDPKLYAPIEQGMVILKHGAANTNAEKFYQYMLSAGARSILEKYGYKTL
jgi:molybdate transport system substrate-binding protein